MAIVILTFALCLFQAPTDEKLKEEGPPQIELATPEAAIAYEEGFAHFSSGDFKAAASSFKSAKKGAKGEAKEVLTAFESACKESKKLPRIEKAIDKQQWRRAYVELQKVSKKLGPKTPLESHLKPLRTMIESQLFFWLANFEADPPEPEAGVLDRRPRSAAITDEAEFIREGEGALRWSSGSQGFGGMTFGSLPLAKFEGARVEEGYRILDLWIYSTDDEFGKFTLYFGTEADGPGTSFNTDILKTKCFYRHETLNKKGWRHIRIDLIKEMPKHHNLSWSDVTGLALLTVPPSKAKTIYIDGVRLERP